MGMGYLGISCCGGRYSDIRIIYGNPVVAFIGVSEQLRYLQGYMVSGLVVVLWVYVLR